MCYFVTSYVENSFCTNDFEKICRKYHVMSNDADNNLHHLTSATAVGFYFTNNYCDCGTPIGGETYKNNEELKRYVSFIKELRQCRNAKYIALLKHWYSGSAIEKPEDILSEEIHANDIDEKYLSDMKDDVLYKIYLYPKYY